jgi:hypothetical protein
MPIDRVCLSNFLKTYSKSHLLYFDLDKESAKRQQLAIAICGYLEDLYLVEERPKPDPKEDL